jgi:hypothetical protein
MYTRAVQRKKEKITTKNGRTKTGEVRSPPDWYIERTTYAVVVPTYWCCSRRKHPQYAIPNNCIVCSTILWIFWESPKKKVGNWRLPERKIIEEDVEITRSTGKHLEEVRQVHSTRICQSTLYKVVWKWWMGGWQATLESFLIWRTMTPKYSPCKC